MGDTKWLRFITIGLILAGIAVGYLLFTGGFAISKTKKISGQVNGVISSPNPVPVETVTPNAYTRIVTRTQSSTKTLPNTGFPIGLIGFFSAGAIFAGWGLRKYPY